MVGIGVSRGGKGVLAIFEHGSRVVGGKAAWLGAEIEEDRV